MIKIDTNDLDKFVVDVRRMSTESKGKVQDVVKNTAFKIERSAKQNIASNGSVKTGHLRRSVATQLGNMEATIHTSNVKYAICVEKGTRPHVIKPKNKKALYWKGAKYPVKFVRHPGGRAKPYLIPAFEKNKSKFIDDLRKVAEW